MELIKNKIFLLFAAVIFFSLIFTAAAPGTQAEEVDVWKLIGEGEHEKALNWLEAREDIEYNLDLRFARALLWSWQGKEEEALEELYALQELAPERKDVNEQLIRVLGWQGQFAEAEKVAKDFADEEEDAEIMALLAVQAEWQQNWPLASSRWQKAAALAEEEEKAAEYLQASEKAEIEMRDRLSGELEAVFPSEQNYVNLGFTVDRWIRPGLTARVGLDLNEIGTGERPEPVLGFSLLAGSPLLSEKFNLGTGIFYRPDDDRRMEFTLEGGYQFRERQTLILETRAETLSEAGEDSIIDLTPQYTINFDNFVLNLGNTMRRRDDFQADFSQQLRLNFPHNRWRPEIKVRRFFDDEYTLELSFDLAHKDRLSSIGEEFLINLGYSEDELRIGTEIINFAR
ncbi:hypothetical protein [Halarsenatibacter silvermanii]|uniref:Tetratricopeptide repeat-containing protein n=1 Tax=Halarsenatibacter silvermanii TaxID=321763 RepID=A0A1G9M4W0_9FIRM|nr:hypothetical protein [Halarsenatibacter silvermanii]SDL69332.1 hypothetical protein SAMN04488692_107111 [Halarsenatibacter silvermanii]